MHRTTSVGPSSVALVSWGMLAFASDAGADVRLTDIVKKVIEGAFDDGSFR